jgi:cyanate permease
MVGAALNVGLRLRSLVCFAALRYGAVLFCFAFAVVRVLLRISIRVVDPRRTRMMLVYLSFRSSSSIATGKSKV